MADLPAPAASPNPALRTRIIAPAEADAWARTAAQGWLTEAPELVDFMRELGRISVNSAGVTAFVAQVDGQAIATASLYLHAGVALLAGASTVPAGRRQGAQCTTPQKLDSLAGRAN